MHSAATEEDSHACCTFLTLVPLIEVQRAASPLGVMVRHDSSLIKSTFKGGLSKRDIWLKNWESLGLLGLQGDGTCNCSDSPRSGSYDGGSDRGTAGDMETDYSYCVSLSLLFAF